MAKQFNVQVKAKHYFSSHYDDIPRFISYFKQIEIVKSLSPDKTLEIGPGNMTVANYLKHSGFSIDTCDFDENLRPDFVADVRNLPVISHCNSRGLMKKPLTLWTYPGNTEGGEHPDEAMSSKRTSTAFLP